VAFRIKDYETAGAKAAGGSGQAGGAESQVEQPALTGVHGLKRVRTASGTDFLDGGFSDKLELAVAEKLEVVGIERDAVMLFGFELEDLGGEVLDCVEEFGVTCGEERGVGTGEFDGDFRGL
jgi:hypothetical protein